MNKSKIEDRLLEYGKQKKEALLKRISALTPTFRPTTWSNAKRKPESKSPAKTEVDESTRSIKERPVSALTRLLHKVQDEAQPMATQEDSSMSCDDLRDLLLPLAKAHSVGVCSPNASVNSNANTTTTPKASSDSRARDGPYGLSSILAKYVA